MPDDTQDLNPSQPSLDELLAQVVAADEAGRPIDGESLAAKHPQHAADLREFIANRNRIQQFAAPLRDAGPQTGGNNGHAHAKIRYFGDYELLEEIAAGGMGIVYKARQVSLNRIVAVKMILRGTLATEDDVKRFRAEAEAAANLQHPGIVAIHEVGLHEGQHYFSMDYVDGQSLAGLPRDKPLSARQAAEYVREAAMAVHAAHQQGTLHRDLKPSNILIDRQGRVRITDFGLAKRISGNSDLTLTGQILGTPSYMPPEQALGKRLLIGVASDVYSLGAVLYELLAGRPPFRGESPAETLRQVETLDPVPPRLLSPTTPRDLETICLKCLDKEPHKRYPTAQHLAEDLGRFLRGEPILARPIWPILRTWRWCRRNPLLALASAAVIALLISIGAVATVAYVRESSLRRQLQTEQQATKKALQESQVSVADMRTQSGLAAAVAGDPAAAALWFSSAAELLGDNNSRSQNNKIRAALWSDLGPRPVHAVMHPEEWVMDVKFDPSGKYLMTWSPQCGPHPGACRIWNISGETLIDLPRGLRQVSCGAWNATGTVLALGGDDGRVLLRSFPDDKAIDELSFKGRIDFLEWDQAGKYLAVAYGDGPRGSTDDRLMITGQKVRVWNYREKTFATPELHQPSWVRTLTFHPQGTQLAITNRDSLCLVFNVPSDSTRPISPMPMWIYQYGPSIIVGQRSPRPIFTDGGRRLLTFPNSTPVTQWDTATWNAIKTDSEPVIGGPQVTDISSDGQWVVAGTAGGVWLLSARTLAARQLRLSKSRQWVFAVSISPDGRHFVSGGGDHEAQLWGLPEAEAIGPPIQHGSSVLAAAWSPDSRHFALAQRGGLVRIWTMGGNPISRDTLSFGGLALLSPSGRYVASRGSTFRDNQGPQLINVFRTADGTAGGPTIESGDGSILDAAFSPDEDSLAIVTAGANQLTVVDWATGKRHGQPVLLPSQPRSVRYRPTGDLIGVLCAGGEIVTVNPAKLVIDNQWSNGAAYSLNNYYTENGAIDFSPSGDALVTYQVDSFVRVWDLNSKKLRYTIDTHTERSSSVTFSRDGKRMATAAFDNRAFVWDYASGRPLSTALTHPDWVFSVSFHPQTDLLITACRDGQVRVWNWRTGTLACPPLQHDHEVHAAAFTPDGRFAVTAGEDNVVRIWELVTGRPMTPPVPLSGAGLNLQVTPDGRRLAVGGFGRGIELISLDVLYDDDPLSSRGRRQFAELTAGRAVESTGGVANLSAERWYEAWREFRSGQAQFVPKDGDELGAVFQAATAPTPSQSQPVIKPFRMLSGHKATVWTVAFSPDGSLLAAGAEDGNILLWELPSGALLKRLTGHTQQVRNLIFSHDGTRLYSGSFDHSIGIWNIAEGKREATLEDPAAVYYLSLSPDDKRLFAASALAQPRMWNLETREVILKPEGHTQAVWVVDYSPLGDMVASGSSDGTVKLWDATSGDCVRTLSHNQVVGSVRFAPDGKTLAVGDRMMSLWRVSDGQELTRFAGGGEGIYDVAFSKDGKLLATASGDNLIRVQDLSASRNIARLEGGMFAVAISPDSKMIAGGATNGGVALWRLSDAARGEETIPIVSDATMTESRGDGPVLILPEPGAVLDNGRVDRLDLLEWEFQWSKVDAADSYVLEIRAPSNAIHTKHITSELTHRISDHAYVALPHCHGWKWRVAALREGQSLGWSEWRSFDIEPPDADRSIERSKQ